MRDDYGELLGDPEQALLFRRCVGRLVYLAIDSFDTSWAVRDVSDSPGHDGLRPPRKLPPLEEALGRLLRGRRER